jgi:Fatty acid cis/trans isomerase (CTI)
VLTKFRIAGLGLLLVVAGCAPMLLDQLDDLYGPADSARYAQPAAPVADEPEYWNDVRPVLEQRCVVCHACYDSPCQLNMTAWEGLARGANPEQVYALRKSAVEPTRLFVDAQNSEEWRQLGFHPVLNERENSPQANLAGSVLYQLLQMKRENASTQQAVLSDKDFTFDLDRKQTCTTIEEIDSYKKKHPQWGMPYGLPALSEQEFSLLEKWLANGAPAKAIDPLPKALNDQVANWEEFLNGNSNKQRLMSRYIYEHLFLGHIYFDEIDTGNKQPVFFRLVRSATPPGTPVKLIPTARPYSDPGTDAVWYRLWRDPTTVVEKTHLPFALNTKRQKNWTKWFLNDDYEVAALPSYDPAIAGNPFAAFQVLPIESRYRFLLDEAQFVVDNFIKGPVCRGQVALSVIDEHFWVFFVNPDSIGGKPYSDFLAREAVNLRLPGQDSSNARVADWLGYEKLETDFLAAKERFLDKAFAADKALNVNSIWDGDGNSNAALTIFRHTDSATVVKGLVGSPPKTAWVIDYTLLERIYYLLVAGFDIYGNIGHQLNTRLYMDFLRMEGEANFLNFLPIKARIPTRDYWYRDTNDRVKNIVYGTDFTFTDQTGIDYRTQNPQRELYKLLAGHIGNALSQEYSLEQVEDKSLEQVLVKLADLQGPGLSALPQTSILRIDNLTEGSQYFTIIIHLGFSNVSHLFANDKRLLPDENYLSVMPGVVGAYPNAFFHIERNDVNQFIDNFAAVKTAQDYATFANRYAVRRTNPRFWDYSDSLHKSFAQQQPVNSGILDLGRFENR